MYFDENEPQAVRDARLAAERADSRIARKAARLSDPVVLSDAHLGAAVVVIALVVIGGFGEFVAPGIGGGVCAVWFAIALAWVHFDGDRGRHALRRAYYGTFGWISGGF